MSSTSGRLSTLLERLEGRVDWERRDQRAAMRVDLESIERLCEALEHPERAVRTVHIAGSKGKGSTAAWFEAGLAARDERVGCYTSPHLEHVNERIRIDGEPISDDGFADALERVLAAEAVLEGPQPTWFDLITATAFVAFAEAQVDWAVIEVGLGGRLDSTNVVKPELCVITSIELEHVEVLGDTREAIAVEKAGILKADVPGLCGMDRDDPASRAIARQAAMIGAPLVYVEPDRHAGFRAANRELALRGLEILDSGRWARGERVRRVHPRDVQEPILPGRMEYLGDLEGVPIVLDGAHTAGSLRAVLAETEVDPALPGRPTVVFGTGRTKDPEALLKVLAGRVDRVLCTSLDPVLHFSSEELAQKAAELGSEAENVSDPWAAVLAGVGESDGRWLLVTGSLHLVGALRPRLVRHLKRNRC